MNRDSWLSIEMRHLAALVAVARAPTLSDAADSLGYGPTAVSRQIAHLERLIGEKLTARAGGGHSMSLTEQGALLVDHAQAILGELDLARQDIGAAPAALASGPNFGVASLFGEWLPAALVASTAPVDQTRSVRVTRGRSHALLHLLEAGAVDAAFVELPIGAGAFSAIKLMSQPCVLALPRTWAQPGDLPLVDVVDCRVTPTLRAQLGAPAPWYSVDSPEAALAFVRAGVASAVVAGSDVDADAGLRLVPADDLPPRVVGLAWHRDRDRDPGLDELKSIARAAVGSAIR